MVLASVNYITVFIEGLGRLPEKLSLAFCPDIDRIAWQGEKNK